MQSVMQMQQPAIKWSVVLKKTEDTMTYLTAINKKTAVWYNEIFIHTLLHFHIHEFVMQARKQMWAG